MKSLNITIVGRTERDLTTAERIVRQQIPNMIPGVYVTGKPKPMEIDDASFKPK